MGKTKIEWTDASWNPIVGCSEVSPGCANCYAARLAATRLRETPQYKGLAVGEEQRGFPVHYHWRGQVRFLPERLAEPLHWRAPRKIFVCDMGDLFHEGATTGFIDCVFAVMALCPQHTFQVLTKRAARMREYLNYHSRDVRTSLAVFRVPGLTEKQQHESVSLIEDRMAQPLPNVWLGVSVENQHFADERIPLVLQTPAAVRWISAEPLLGSLDFSNVKDERGYQSDRYDALRGRYAVTCSKIPHEMSMGNVPKLDWVVCGGESGPNARPMHPDWARSLRDQCQSAGVPFFFKQWGEWYPISHQGLCSSIPVREFKFIANDVNWARVGKKAAGRLLDGRTWDEFPATPLVPIG